MILYNVGEVYIHEHGHHISALTHTRALILSKNVLPLNYVTFECGLIFATCKRCYVFSKKKLFLVHGLA